MASPSRGADSQTTTWTRGLGYGAALWLLGDELAVPLLGLSKGPTAHAPRVHAQASGAHLVYGLATGAALHALERRL